ncbi:MAG: hypothetical protein QM788_03950 [Roseateles sp.]|uniref:hypothetical protein n=1 Tax=Roseateles sp. TaxID=1971397 RepID=UPI0039E7B242
MNLGARSTVWAAALLACLAAQGARAGCSRPIEVPMAPLGPTIGFDGTRASGAYPALLREVGGTSGCVFRIQRVPRARLQKMFESGKADLLLPASPSPSRDRDGEFIPLVLVRANLLTLAERGSPVPRSLAELLARPGYKLALVRGFSFGPTYDRAIGTLRAQHRVIEETDPASVARALQQGLAQATIMPASIFFGTLAKDAQLAPLIKRTREEPLEELGWSESGVYLSRHALTDADRRTLRTAFTQAARAGRMWQLSTDTHPPGSLNSSVRPLPPTQPAP